MLTTIAPFLLWLRKYKTLLVIGFMAKNQLKSAFKNVSFENSEFKSLTFGIASIHYEIKPLQK